MAVAEFPLPDVGEGLTEAEIVQWRVAIGDEIAVDQVLVEIETAKSLVELPSPFAGTVTGLLVSEGDTVEVGKPIIRVESDASVASGAPTGTPTGGAAPVADAAPASPVVAAAAAPAPAPAPVAQAPVAQTPPAPAAAPAASPAAAAPQARHVAADPEVADHATVVGSDESSGAVLVGYGSATTSPSRRKPGARRAAALAAEASRASSADAQAAAEAASDPGEDTTAEAVAAQGSRPRKAVVSGQVLAKPPIRKLAKDLDVDLGEVVPTGLAGEVTRDDVIRHAKQAGVFRNIETPEWGDVRRETIPVKGVRKAIATAMTTSKFTAPHVSLFVDVDATRTMEFVKRLKSSPTFAGVKVSPLLVFAKAVIWAVRRNRAVNSTWTDQEIIVHHFVNLGIAAATPAGSSCRTSRTRRTCPCSSSRRRSRSSPSPRATARPRRSRWRTAP